MKFLFTPYSTFLESFYKQPYGPEQKSWFALHEEQSDNPELYIYDFIGMYGVEPMAIAQELKKVNGKELKVRLNTPGGNAFDGFAIYNLLREHKGGLTVIVDGLAASAGSLIMMAGEKIIMKPGSRAMIHDAWGLTMGNADDHLYSADRLNEVSADIAAVYSERTGVSKRMVRQMMKAETWLTAKQAKEQGFADEIDQKPTENDKAQFVVPEGMYKNPDAITHAVGSGITGKDQKNSLVASVQVVPAIESEPVPSFSLETEERRLRLANV